VQDTASHWFSAIDCIHGHTAEGIWTLQPVVDDRNFLYRAQATFANHKTNWGCDCLLELGWEPSFQPPDPPTQQVAAQVKPAASGTIADYSVVSMLPPVVSWFRGEVDCQHGTTLSGVWLGTPGQPPLANLQSEGLQNHQRVLSACNCTYQSGALMAVPIQQVTDVPPYATIAIPQNASGQPPSDFVFDSQGRLSFPAGGNVAVSASFSLLQSCAGGAAGFGFVCTTTPSTAPAMSGPVVTFGTLTDVNGAATVVLSWSGTVPPDTSFDLAFSSGCQFVTDVQTGSLSVTLLP
jgi:hypothetical protein